MPLTKSVIKRMKQSEVARKRNASTKKAFKVAEKNVARAVESGKKADVQKAMNELFSKLDTAVKKNVIHKNKAARKKSQLYKTTKVPQK